ncbi:hypothetical protein B0H14DRAFT_3507763 [Mycena olivaceomarginata]|nr:hypothetical protein B0H14DRAFT_3507763 [Mycena olivaceomarginata]
MAPFYITAFFTTVFVLLCACRAEVDLQTYTNNVRSLSEPAKRESPTRDQLGDSELLDIVLVASVDGKFHAFNRKRHALPHIPAVVAFPTPAPFSGISQRRAGTVRRHPRDDPHSVIGFRYTPPPARRRTIPISIPRCVHIDAGTPFVPAHTTRPHNLIRYSASPARRLPAPRHRALAPRLRSNAAVRDTERTSRHVLPPPRHAHRHRPVLYMTQARDASLFRAGEHPDHHLQLRPHRTMSHAML